MRRHEIIKGNRLLLSIISFASVLRLVVPLASQAGDSVSAQPSAANSSPAKSAFERFKKLEGKWRGRSTKGWEETITYKTIAAGSAVVETSFDAHPNETMLTVYHVDGDRLLLTHYCVSKTQPRLLATSFDDDGRTLTFTFLDGTSLPSRPRSHGQVGASIP